VSRIWHTGCGSYLHILVGRDVMPGGAHHVDSDPDRVGVHCRNSPEGWDSVTGIGVPRQGSFIDGYFSALAVEDINTGNRREV
jgi:hypothetical protein